MEEDLYKLDTDLYRYQLLQTKEEEEEEEEEEFNY